jgi:sugar (pentulose or hexulose) kinase
MDASPRPFVVVRTPSAGLSRAGRLVAGAARSPYRTWAIADVTGYPVEMTAGTKGAALLVAKAIG